MATKKKITQIKETLSRVRSEMAKPRITASARALSKKVGHVEYGHPLISRAQTPGIASRRILPSRESVTTHAN